MNNLMAPYNKDVELYPSFYWMNIKYDFNNEFYVKMNPIVYRGWGILLNLSLKQKILIFTDALWKKLKNSWMQRGKRGQ